MLGLISRRQVRTAGWAYLAVGLFALAYAISRGGYSATQTTSIVVGTLVAAPLVVALIGQRISGIRTPFGEISFQAVAVPLDTNLSVAVAQVAGVYTSGTTAVSDAIVELAAGDRPLVEINLRDGRYWWSTRIFVVAALAMEYTAVEAFLFVEGGSARRFVGLASTRAIRHRLAVQFPDYERNFRHVLELASAGATAETIGAPPETNQLLNHWTYGFGISPMDQVGRQEAEVKQEVAAEDLRRWLGRDLQEASLPHRPMTPLVQYRICTFPAPWVPLVADGRLVGVVQRSAVARTIAERSLERSLQG